MQPNQAEKKMNIVLSTRNPSKAEQIKAVFVGFPISVITLSEAGIEGDVVEDGNTLEENAIKKAVFAHRLGSWSMADDTGLFRTAESPFGKYWIISQKNCNENAAD